MQYKRGELTSGQIISMIIIIIGFVILVSFLVSLNLNEQSEQEACKLSVLGRATSPDVAQSLVPLKCTTEKICITSGSGKCEESFAGEKVQRVTLPGDETAAAEVISALSAEAMYECWNMMGQGKLDLFASASQNLVGSKGQTTCVICSRVAIDKDVDVKILEKVDINEYMRTHQAPGSSVTYIQAFTDRSVQSYANINRDALTKIEDKSVSIAGHDGSGEGGVNRQMAIVFSQVKSEKVGDVLSNMGSLGVTLAAGSFMFGPGKLGRAALFTPTGLLVTGTVAVSAASYGAYNARQGQLAAASYCGSFTSNTQKAEEGCSVVQGINYNVNDINAVCDVIQGSP